MRLKTLCLAALILAAVCVTPASALEYTMDAPDDSCLPGPPAIPPSMSMRTPTWTGAKIQP